MKLSNILTAIFLFTIGMSAQAQTTQMQSLLWKIEGDNIQTSYLFGTMHLLPQNRFELKEKVSKAFDKSEQIVLELDMDAPDLQVAIMQSMPMKDGQTLDQLMSEEDYQKLDGILQKQLGAGLSMFNTWKPIGITSMLYAMYIDGQPASFEGTFVSRAKEQEKEVLGLETVSEQMQVFDDIPYTEQIKDIVDLMYEEARNQAYFSEMVELYLQEDLAGLYEFTTRYLDTEDEKHFLLDRRNQHWIPRIGQLAKDKTTFFGVGAAHLGGDQGVIRLLKDAGYKITPVY